MAEIIYPQYDFTFEILSSSFETGTLTVKYIPVNTDFTTFEYIVPILPSFDITNLKAYVLEWCPNDRWFAQETILSSLNIVGAKG